MMSTFTTMSKHCEILSQATADYLHLAMFMLINQYYLCSFLSYFQYKHIDYFHQDDTYSAGKGVKGMSGSIPYNMNCSLLFCYEIKIH